MESKNIFSQLLDFLIGNVESRENKKLLKQMAKRLEKEGFPFVKWNKVQPYFAKEIYEIYEQTETPRVLYNKHSYNLAELVYLSVLPAEIVLDIDKVDPGKIQADSLLVPYSKLVDNVRKSLMELKNYFTKEVLLDLDNSYRIINSFRLFCMFDYYQLLKCFSSMLVESDFSSEQRFAAVQYKYVADYISDFASVADLLTDCDKNAKACKILRQIDGSITLTEEDYRILYNKLCVWQKSEVLTDLCRIIQGNPTYAFMSTKAENGNSVNWIKEIFANAEDKLKKIYAEQQKKQVEKLSKNLFTPDMQLNLEYYTEFANAKLSQKNVVTFCYPKILGFLYAFLNEYIVKQLKQFTDVMTIRGKCYDQEFVTELNILSNDLVEESLAIKKLDMNLSFDNSGGFKITQVMKSESPLKETLNAAVSVVNMSNGGASNILHNTRSELTNLNDKLIALIQDSKRKTGEIIENWKSVSTFAEKESSDFFSELKSKSEQMIALINLYVPIDN